MPDTRLVQWSDFPLRFAIDFLLLSDGTLDDSQALATAVVVALGTDRLAYTSDILPDPDSTNRAGWWGDLEADTIWGGWQIGCRLWLLRRTKIVGPEARGGATVTLVEQYIREALTPFVELRICSSFTVSAWRAGLQQINAQIVIYRAAQPPVDLQYQLLWDELESVVSVTVDNPATAPARRAAQRNLPRH